MYLSRIDIKNFRGIKSLEMKFDPALTVIMGENNAGKSSLLAALEICLNQLRSEKGSLFNVHDFHLDESHLTIDSCEPIRITVSFEETEELQWTPAEKQRLKDIDVGVEYSEIHLQIEASYDSSNREINQLVNFLDNLGNVIPNRATAKNLKALRGCVPFFLQEALRDAARNFGGQSSYWVELIKSNDLSDEDKAAFERDIVAVQKRLIDAYGGFLSVTKELDHVSDILDTGIDGHVTVEPRFPDITRAIRYETEINYQISEQAKIPIKNFGEGTQSIAVLMLFNAYLKMKMAINGGFTAPLIGIEEPETHLHPNAVYTIWNVLKTLAGQKIVVTHSGEIVSQSDLKCIRKLQRFQGDILCREISLNLSVKEEEKFRIHFRRGRGELFFSRVWLLVEGATELEVYDGAAGIMGIDLHRHSVGFVQYASIGIGVILKIADAFGIRCVLTSDSDPAGNNYFSTFTNFMAGHPTILTHKHHMLPSLTIETYLCEMGFSQPYINHLTRSSDPEARELLSVPDSQRKSTYWEQVYRFIKSNKPHLVNEALDLMGAGGVNSVPQHIRDVINDVIA